MLNQQKLDELFLSWAEEIGMVMDSKNDKEDYAARGHLFDDPGSDVNDTFVQVF